MISVMICDDIKEIRDNLKQMIDSQEDMKVVSMAETAEEAIRSAREKRPDVILMDVQMDEVNSGILATHAITNSLPHTRVIMLTVHNNDDLIADAYRVGAVDYILKDATRDDVCDSIRKVYQNEEFLGKLIAKVLRDKMSKMQKQEISILYLINHLFALTPTEMMILKLLYQKKTRKMLAKEKFLSEETVNIHIRHILRKLDFNTTSEMVSNLRHMGVMEYFEEREG